MFTNSNSDSDVSPRLRVAAVRGRRGQSRRRGRNARTEVVEVKEEEEGDREERQMKLAEMRANLQNQALSREVSEMRLLEELTRLQQGTVNVSRAQVPQAETRVSTHLYSRPWDSADLLSVVVPLVSVALRRRGWFCVLGTCASMVAVLYGLPRMVIGSTTVFGYVERVSSSWVRRALLWLWRGPRCVQIVRDMVEEESVSSAVDVRPIDRRTQPVVFCEVNICKMMPEELFGRDYLLCHPEVPGNIPVVYSPILVQLLTGKYRRVEDLVSYGLHQLYASGVNIPATIQREVFVGSMQVAMVAIRDCERRLAATLN